MRFKKTLLAMTIGLTLVSGQIFANENSSTVNAGTSKSRWIPNINGKKFIRAIETTDKAIKKADGTIEYVSELESSLAKVLGADKPKAPVTATLTYTYEPNPDDKTQNVDYAAVGFANGDVVTFQMKNNDNGIEANTLQVYKPGNDPKKGLQNHEVTALAFVPGKSVNEPSYLYVGHGVAFVEQELESDPFEIFEGKFTLYSSKTTREAGKINVIPIIQNLPKQEAIQVGGSAIPEGAGILSLDPEVMDKKQYLFVAYGEPVLTSRTDTIGLEDSGLKAGPIPIMTPYVESDDDEDSLYKNGDIGFGYISQMKQNNFNKFRKVADQANISFVYPYGNAYYIGYKDGAVRKYAITMDDGIIGDSGAHIVEPNDQEVAKLKFDTIKTSNNDDVNKYLDELFIVQKTGNNQAQNAIYGVPFGAKDESSFYKNTEEQELVKESASVHAFVASNQYLYTATSWKDNNNFEHHEIWSYHIDTEGKIPDVIQKVIDSKKLKEGMGLTNIMVVSPDGDKLVLANTDGWIGEMDLNKDTGAPVNGKINTLYYPDPGNPKSIDKWGHNRKIESIHFIDDNKMQIILGSKTEWFNSDEWIGDDGSGKGPEWKYEVTNWSGDYTYDFSDNKWDKKSNGYCHAITHVYAIKEYAQMGGFKTRHYEEVDHKFDVPVDMKAYCSKVN